jgi:hypothetical protein
MTKPKITIDSNPSNHHEVELSAYSFMNFHWEVFMGFFKKLFGGRLKELSKTGITESVCPYCGIELSKFPGRKTKCKSCGNQMYVRTRPTDKKKVIIKEDEIEIYEEIKAIEGGWHDEYLEGRKVREEIELEKGRKLSDIEFEIELTNKSLYESIINKDWGSLKLDYFRLGNFINQTGQRKVALDNYLMSFYCAVNTGFDVIAFESAADYDDIDPSPFFLNTKIDCFCFDEIMSIIEKNNITYEDATKYVETYVKRFHENYGFPLTPEKFNDLIKERFF